MFKNVANQKIEMFVFDSATGLPKTGDAANLTAYVSKDYGTVTVLGDTSATEKDATNAKGWYMFDLTQTETNFDCGLFSGKSSTSGCVMVARPVFTLPPLFTTLAINSTGAVLIQTNLKRGAAITGRHVLMVNATTGAPEPSKTVTVTRAKGTGAFASATPSTCTEISDGLYWFGGSTGDTDDAAVTFKFEAGGCRTQFLSYVFEP